MAYILIVLINRDKDQAHYDLDFLTEADPIRQTALHSLRSCQGDMVHRAGRAFAMTGEDCDTVSDAG